MSNPTHIDQDAVVKSVQSGQNLLPAQRQQVILDFIKKNYTARSSQLSQLLHVSEMTIRRDLMALENQDLVKRTHGGAVFRHERMTDRFQYRISQAEKFNAKLAIAKKACQMIEPHDVVFIGEGVTAALMLRHMPADIPFSIYSNNFGVITETAARAIHGRLIFMGGEYNAVTCATAGSFTLEMIRQINADKVFLGVDGFNLRDGLTAENPDIAAINRAMIQNTIGEVIIMPDQTKFGLVAAMKIAEPQKIDVLVTDWKIPADFRRELEPFNINIITT